MTREEKTQTVVLMLHCVRLHRCRCEQQIGELPVHPSWHRMLMEISKSKDPPTQKDVAEHLKISAAAASASIKKLENSGYIFRASSEDDLRENRIWITDEGRKIIEKTHDIFAGIDDRMFCGLTEEQLSTLRTCLEKIVDNMKGETDEKMA